MFKLINRSTHSRLQVKRGFIDLNTQSTLDHHYQVSIPFRDCSSLSGMPSLCHSEGLLEIRAGDNPVYGYETLTLGSVTENTQDQQVDL